MGHHQQRTTPDVQRPSPAPDIDVDVEHARGQARRVSELLETAAAQRAELIAAKKQGDPVKLLLVAADVERTQLLLEFTGHIIDYSAMLPGGDAPELATANKTAKAAATALASDVAKARGQADRLEHANAGSVSERDVHTTRPGTREDTRARADEQAPAGFCDDKEAQGLDSEACPLDDDQRARVRAKVRYTLGMMVTNWKQAILKKEFETQIAALAKDRGMHPLAELLLDVISFGVGGKASSMVLEYADRATGLVQLAKVSAAEVAMLPLRRMERASNALRLSENRSAVTGLVKKLSSRTVDALVAKSDATSVSISDQLERVADAWANSARDDIDQLTDPDLVALCEQLATTRHDQAYFDQKVAALTAAYRTVAALGSSDYTGEPLRLAWITSTGSPARLATYRRHDARLPLNVTEMSIDIVSTLAGSPRLDFEAWVDPSMYALALAREPAPLRVDATDMRWSRMPLMLAAPDEGFEMVGVTPDEDLR